MLIIVEQLAIYSEEAYLNGLKAVSVAQRRNIPDALNPKIKSLNYLNNILVKIQSNFAGADEAIMMNAQGYVTEGSGDNIFIVKTAWSPRLRATLVRLKALRAKRLSIYAINSASN